MKTKSIIAALCLATIAVTAHAQSTFNKYQPANGVQCNTGLTYIDTACAAAAIPAAGSTTQMIYNLAGVYTGNAQATVAADLGLIVGSATGGSKGPGTLNATALYINGAAVGTSSGAVSSVALVDGSSTPIYIITGSPVTAAGTLTETLRTQSANLLFAGPASGSAAQPSFRSLVTADLPASGVSAGSCTYCALTMDATGRVTVQSSGTAPASAANPSGLIGLTAANGVATTFTRSDATHALDQSISPTWTGPHVFGGAFNSGAITTTVGLQIGQESGSIPLLAWMDHTQAVDNRAWLAFTNAGTFNLSTLNDANSANKNAFAAARSGTTVTGVVLGNSPDFPAITLDGPVSINGPAAGAALTVNPQTGQDGIHIVAQSGQAPALQLTSSGSFNSFLNLGAGGPGAAFLQINGTSWGEVTQSGNLLLSTPSGGTTLTVNTVGGGSAGAAIFGPVGTANSLASGATLALGDNSTVSTIWSNNGGQSELWQFNSSTWNEIERVTTARAVEFAAPSGGPFAVCTTVTCGTVLFQVQNSGSIGMPFLGTSTAAQTGYLCWSSSGGALTVDSTNTCLVSSIRYKKNVKPLEFGLDAVMKLRPISYEYKDGFMPDKFNPGRQDGFIAEEVQKVDPRLTPLDTEGKPKSVEYAQMSAMLVRAIQDQQQEIWELRVALGALAVVSLIWLSALTWKRRHGH